jgi:hypothetical protein
MGDEEGARARIAADIHDDTIRLGRRGSSGRGVTAAAGSFLKLPLRDR